MKDIRHILAAAVLAGTLTACSSTRNIFSDAFVNNYNGAGFFTQLYPEDTKGTAGRMSLDTPQGFDTVLCVKVKLFDKSKNGVIWEEVKSPVEIHFGLTNRFINAHKAVKEDVFYRGDMARYYKTKIYGTWRDSKYGKYFEGIAVVAVKSEIGALVIQYAYLRFWNHSWMSIALNKQCLPTAGKINHLGTLLIDLYRDPDVNKITGRSSLRVMQGDLAADFSYFETHYSSLFAAMGKSFEYFTWEE